MTLPALDLGPSVWVVLAGTLPRIAIAWLLAAYAHEATHALVARALGGRVADVDWWTIGVYIDWPQDAPAWRLRATGVAPLGAGLLLTAALAVTGELPTSIAWGGAVLIYTLGGSLQDYSLTALYGREWWWRQLDQRSRDTVLAGGFALGGAVVLLLGGPLALPGRVIRFAQGVTLGGGAAYCGVVVYHALRERSRDAGSSPAAESRPGSEGSYPATGGGAATNRLLSMQQSADDASAFSYRSAQRDDADQEGDP